MQPVLRVTDEKALHSNTGNLNLTTMNTKKLQDEIIEDFKYLENWEDKYQYIIDLGKELAPFPEQFRDEAHKVKGCVSQVWLRAEEDGNIIHFQGDSDAHIPKGLISLLLRVYSGQNREEIASTPPYFIEEIGLGQNLTPSRTNGLYSMVKRIQAIAAGN